MPFWLTLKVAKGILSQGKSAREIFVQRTYEILDQNNFGQGIFRNDILVEDNFWSNKSYLQNLRNQFNENTSSKFS